MNKVTVLFFSFFLWSSVSIAQDGGGASSNLPGPLPSLENERGWMESLRDYEKFMNDEAYKDTKKSRSKFGKIFSQAQEAILKDDMPAAKKLVVQLHEIKNLNAYEESRLHLIDYWYYGKSGDQESEFNAAARLMAVGAGNIDSHAFVEAGMRLLKRQYNRQDIGGAIETLANLRKEPESAPELMSVVQAVKKLDELAEQQSDFTQKITVDESGAWSAKLFKPRFFFNGVSGEISNLGFDCTNKQATLTYKADAVMEIPDAWGSCVMKVNAKPQTSFNLVQQKAG